MNLTKLFILIFVGLLLCNTTFAVKKAVYPDPKALQPIPAGTESGAQENMNYEQAQIIKNNLDSSGQTLDAQKLVEISKEKDLIVLGNVSVSSNFMWVFVLVLIGILVIIIVVRFSQKNNK